MLLGLSTNMTYAMGEAGVIAIGNKSVMPTRQGLDAEVSCGDTI